jgi:hypothetical protein
VTCIQKEVKARIVHNHNLPTIKRIPDNYGMSLKRYCLKKSRKRLLVDRLYHTERYMMESFTYLEQDASGRIMLPKEHGSGSTCHRRFQEWNKLDIFRMTWAKLLKIYDEKVGIN